MSEIHLYITRQVLWKLIPCVASFGYELAIDANLSNIIFGLYSKTKHFGQTSSGYVRLTAFSFRYFDRTNFITQIASIYGLLNIITRPVGGYMGDIAYRWYGVRGKKYLVLGLGVLQGAMSLAWGLYIDRNDASRECISSYFQITSNTNQLFSFRGYFTHGNCRSSRRDGERGKLLSRAPLQSRLEWYDDRYRGRYGKSWRRLVRSCVPFPTFAVREGVLDCWCRDYGT